MAVHLGNENATRRQHSVDRGLERDADGDAAVATAEHGSAQPSAVSDPAALSRLLPPSPRDANAQHARWGRDPEGARREPAGLPWRGRGPRSVADDPAACC
jgi:hypothetical protein